MSEARLQREQAKRMEHARDFMRKAVAFDEAAEFQQAKDMYIAAIEMLISVNKFETKDAVKRKLRMRIDELFLRAETLKEKIEYFATHPEEEEEEKAKILGNVAKYREKKQAEAKAAAEAAAAEAAAAAAKARAEAEAAAKLEAEAAANSKEVVSRVKRRGRPAVGLANLGQTCYLNSTLQCLASTDVLINSIVEKCSKSGQLPPFLDVFMETLKELHSSEDNKFIFPDSLFQAVGRAQAEYLGNEQQDAMDVFQVILSELHKALNVVKAPPPSAPPPMEQTADMMWKQAKLADQSCVNDLFDYQTQTAITCRKCAKLVSTRYEMGRYVVVLPLTQEAFANGNVNAESNSLSIQWCLQRFFATNETLADYRCPECKSTNCCESATQLVRPPQIMVLQIKRRGIDGRTKVRIETPLSLDMAPYFAPDSPDSTHTNYELYGIINHNEVEASVKTARPPSTQPAAYRAAKPQVKVVGGHYTAIAKAGEDGQTWYWFNDSKAVKIPARKVHDYVCTKSALAVGMFYQLVTSK